MTEFIIKRSDNRKHWNVFEDDEFICEYPQGYKAMEVVTSIREMYPSAKIGIKAIDLGPAIAYECARQGYGQVLWMK